jgi:flagellar biosynthesis/type III secretory pathway chaperone
VTDRGADAARIRAHMDKVLQEEARLLGELDSLLERESAVVRGEDAAAIEGIGTARQGCVERLAGLDAERTGTCRMLSFGSGREGITALYAWCDPAGTLLAQWQSNLRAARRCKDQNDRNGAVVNLRMGQVQQLLATLRGGAVNAPVYGPQGQRGTGYAHRELGQA